MNDKTLEVLCNAYSHAYGQLELDKKEVPRLVRDGYDEDELKEDLKKSEEEKERHKKALCDYILLMEKENAF